METSANGVRIHWQEAGVANDSPPLVLLHGLNDCHLTWKAVVRDLARDRRVLMPDLPGHGLSERPDASYALPWYAEVMTAWIDAIGLAEVDIVGHSFGGGVAQMLLLTCRPRIRRLVLVSSGGLGREIAVAMRLASIPWVVEHLGQPFMSIGTGLARRYVHDGRPADEIATLCAMNATQGSARAFARTVRDLVDWRGQRRTYDQRIAEVSRLPPTCVVWGTDDPIIPVAHAKAFATALAGVRLVTFDRCSHHPHCEQPRLFVRTLRDFLQ